MSLHTKGRIIFRPDGDANRYAMMDETGGWLMTILHNGETVTARQEANFKRLADLWNSNTEADVPDIDPDDCIVRQVNHDDRSVMDIEWWDSDRREIKHFISLSPAYTSNDDATDGFSCLYKVKISTAPDDNLTMAIIEAAMPPEHCQHAHDCCGGIYRQGVIFHKAFNMLSIVEVQYIRNI